MANIPTVNNDRLNQVTEQALAEFSIMKDQPDIYKRYDSFDEVLDDVLND